MTNFDDLKGRAKEAAGDLTDNEDLEREGKVDQATGNFKEKAGDAAGGRVAVELQARDRRDGDATVEAGVDTVRVTVG